MVPWDWRRGQRIVQVCTERARPAGCDIKGNINRQGEKIYLPGDRWYDQARIDESRG